MIRVKKDQLEALYRELNLANVDYSRAQGSLEAVSRRLERLRTALHSLEKAEVRDTGSQHDKPQQD